MAPMISARRQFLDVFLGALGAAEIVEYVEQADAVTGAIRYVADSEVVDLSGDEGEELQYFVWRISEAEAPSVLTYRIVEVMERYQLLHIDKLRVSRETLLSILQTDSEQQVDPTEFAMALDELFAIEVPMVEDGEETGDAFFIHE
jgi:hypothetical protein